MKYKIAVLGLCLLLVPAISLAQDGTGLVPCGNPGQEMCTTEHAIAFAAGLINFLISMLGVVAVIALVYVGFKMVTSRGDTGAWKNAKNMFTNVVIGIIIILGAWVAVDTVLKILTDRGGLEEWSSELGTDIDTYEDGCLAGSRDPNTGYCTGGGF